MIGKGLIFRASRINYRFLGLGHPAYTALRDWEGAHFQGFGFGARINYRFLGLGDPAYYCITRLGRGSFSGFRVWSEDKL